MKAILILLTCFMLIGCGDTKVIDGVEYDTYGLFDEKTKKNPNIKYEVIPGNIVWSVILAETIIMPIYFIGFSIYEPVGRIDDFTMGEVK